MIDYWKVVVGGLTIIIEDPVFRTGNDDWDFWLTFALYALLLASGIEVAKTVIRRYKACRNAEDVRGKTINYLLGFAFVAYAIVNVLRWEHRRLKLAQFSTLQTWEKAEDLVLTRSWTSSVTTTFKNLGRRVVSQTYGKLPQPIVDRVPWMPPDWSHDTSVCDYFKLLVGDGRTNFWTRQWYMGFFAWTLYISLQNTTHNLNTWFIISLVILAYHFSLAGAQALFEAVLLMGHPTGRSPHRRQAARPEVIALFTATLAGLLEAIPWTLQKAESGSKSFWEGLFVVGQGLLLVASIFVPVMSSLHRRFQFPSPCSRFYPLTRSDTRAIRRSWAAIGVSSLLLHIHSIWQCLAEAKPGAYWRWSHVTFLLQPWHDAKRKLFKDTMFRIFGLLGDHPWINALAWDVIFSAIVVGFTAFISSVHVKDMLQCSLIPWWDNAIEAAEQILEVVQDTTTASMVRGKEVLDQAQAATRSGLLGVASAGLEKGQQLAASSDFDLADSVEDKFGRLKDLVDAQASSPTDSEASSSRTTRSRGRASRTRSARAQTTESAGILPRRSNRHRDSRSTNARPASEATTAESSMDQTLRSLHLEEDAMGVAEQAGLAYALFIFGGLGLASAGVFGAAVLQ